MFGPLMEKIKYTCLHTDADVEGYKRGLLNNLKNHLEVMNTHSMNDTVLVYQGHKECLEEVIRFIEEEM